MGVFLRVYWIMKDFNPSILDNQTRIFIERAPGLMALVDPEMRYLAVSKNWLEEYGQGKNIVGCTHTEVFPDIQLHWKKMLDQCLTAKGQICDEVNFQKPDGSNKWIRCEVHPWYACENEIGGATILVNDITAFKKKEEEDSRKIEILDKTNDVARIGTWEVNLITGKITWSKVTREIHEVDSDYEPVLETAINFFKKGESRTKITKAVKEATTNGSPYDVELELITAKGNTVWARSIGQAEFENGKCKRLYGVFQDLTERKKAERIIADERKLLKTVVDNIPLNIYMKDLQSRKTLVNKRELEYMGVDDEQDLIGKSDYDLFPPESAAISVAEDQNIFKTGQPLEGLETYNFFEKDKEGTWFMTSKIPLRNEDNEITGLLGIGFDITDRKLAENQVTKLLDELRAIMKATTEVVIIGTDLNGLITHFNRGAENLLSYKAEEVVGVSPLIFHDKNEIGKRLSELSKLANREIGEEELFIECAKQDKHIAKQWTYFRKDGSSFPVQLVVTSIKNNEGEIQGSLSIAADITERVENHKR